MPGHKIPGESAQRFPFREEVKGVAVADGRLAPTAAGAWLGKDSAVVFGRLSSAAKQAPGTPASVRLSVKIGARM